MANGVISILIYIDLLLVSFFYLYLRKRKEQISYTLGMTSSMAVGGLTALLTGILLIMQFPFHFTYITMFSALIGGFVGAFYGRLVDRGLFVLGLTNGIMIGLMAPMIGTVIEMPVPFIGVLHVFFIGCILTIFWTLKRT
ncbi:hypothetical protein MHZ95_18475 [Sporosarcina sp. ACRSM]|uniref:hypothetical protein n=1 Tax=Sporosarcina sp. ACRSM TaxID=2918216 RepID=UPI001EF43F3C|nr:hypothetical protein [Sporosarcina sp. ACRSM]MCG7337246.1 hypothetical protein [Sporosarcina sp. ACRSM]